MRYGRGFTLIELLVAMAIVAVIGVIALTGINTAIEQQTIASERAERWREVQLAMRIIVNDLSQVHPRVTRDETGSSFMPAFVADPTRQFALEFSRGGWSNPAGFPRGTVLRVAYDIEEDILVRFHWPVTDRTLATPPVRTELLTGISQMEVQFINDAGESSPDWPPGGFGDPRSIDVPRAVRFLVELDDYGQLWRLIEVSS
ncbi:MAG: type II secretion system minor pseudopilin GspJ [Gammaproteobacteria bacterium]|nr:type II secretion system minor pseudopilin GspJ [Gammaproteobacteria bacterium]